MTGFEHRAVMDDEVRRLLDPVGDGVLVDVTLGGAGHARRLLDEHPALRLLGIDRDPEALAAARSNLGAHQDRVRLRQASFDALADIVGEEGLEGDVAAVLFDLGVSSPQLDRPERGFSYHYEGPLDMRRSAGEGPTAADLLDDITEADLRRLLRENADERHAGRIAAAIVAARPLSTTTELADVVREAVPAAARRGAHPARRTFQALRMAVNDELPTLGRALDQAIDVLRPGGRLVVISYHSGEDRLVKRRLDLAATGGCVCPPGLPCQCGARSTLRLFGRRGVRPSAEEVEANPRARSARLRAAERVDDEAAA